MFYFIHLHSTSTSRRHTHAISCVRLGRLGRLGLSIDHMCVNAEQIYLTPDAAIAAIHTCGWTLTSMHMYTCMYNVCVCLCTCIEKCKKMWICTENVENKCTYGSQGISNTLLNKVNRSFGGNNQLTVNKVCQLWWRFFCGKMFFSCSRVSGMWSMGNWIGKYNRRFGSLIAFEEQSFRGRLPLFLGLPY